MRVLFVASNPEGSPTLNLEREITELQRRFSQAPGEPVSFSFQPALSAEDLPQQIARHRPDILHLSAHGDTPHLALANEAKQRVYLTAKALAAFLPVERPPQLIYLNACDSAGIAESLSAAVPMAIGSNAPITNRAARAGAMAFYERILSGSTVRQAFDVAQTMVEMMQNKEASAVLEHRPDIDPSTEVLYRVPRLIADFVDGIPRRNRKGEYGIRLGLIGCPANTIQVVFFTDDDSFLDEGENPYGDMVRTVRTSPVRSVIWDAPFNGWWVVGDFRIFAFGVTGDGETFTAKANICEAIEARYRLAPAARRATDCSGSLLPVDGAHGIPRDIAAAIVELRRENGEELEYAPARLKYLVLTPRKARKQNSSRDTVSTVDAR